MIFWIHNFLIHTLSMPGKGTGNAPIWAIRASSRLKVMLVTGATNSFILNFRFYFCFLISRLSDFFFFSGFFSAGFCLPFPVFLLLTKVIFVYSANLSRIFVKKCQIFFHTVVYSFEKYIKNIYWILKIKSFWIFSEIILQFWMMISFKFVKYQWKCYCQFGIKLQF